MNVEMTEINGFLIDTFNQHNLETGKAPDRKPKNEKAKCASYDWERGLGTCHNCNKPFQLHTYQRKGASEKVYERPDQVAIHAPSTKVEEWFGARGISKQTLIDLRIGEGPELCLKQVKQKM